MSVFMGPRAEDINPQIFVQQRLLLGVLNRDYVHLVAAWDIVTAYSPNLFRYALGATPVCRSNNSRKKATSW
jgi:hypothetical protein